MSREEVPPEEPGTASDELIDDASREGRTRDAALHSAKKAEEEGEAGDGEVALTAARDSVGWRDAGRTRSARDGSR